MMELLKFLTKKLKLRQMFDNKKILITGGTGSFGKKFISKTINKFNPKKLIIFSRDEMKQWNLSLEYGNTKNIDFIIGDIRDKQRLRSVLNGVEIVIHAAATKIVPTAEYNPFECIKTNINGAMNLIDACKENQVEKVIALSTDKASNPINLYGATKLASDKLFIAANSPNNHNSTKFSVVRYGNVMGSRGSVIPFFLKNNKKPFLSITDERMTRFMISLDQAVELVWHAYEDMIGGEIYVKKIPSIKIIDIAKAISPNCKLKIIGIRPGEKLHEQMIGIEDANYTYEYKGYYKILPSIYNWGDDPERIKKGVKVGSKFEYISNTNSNWMTSDDLKNWIENNKYEIELI